MTPIANARARVEEPLMFLPPASWPAMRRAFQLLPELGQRLLFQPADLHLRQAQIAGDFSLRASVKEPLLEDLPRPHRRPQQDLLESDALLHRLQPRIGPAQPCGKRVCLPVLELDPRF